MTAVHMNSGVLAVCTPMMRHPTQHTAACRAAMIASKSPRPNVCWATVRFSISSSSTSRRKMTMSMNTPIQSVRLMNSGAMAEP